ncbi:MAG: NADP-dependent malic enzyme [Kiritimatiellae bacterium]|nr:NADP-dependent malic enzyme [Kiritimatiellia bacterium]
MNYAEESLRLHGEWQGKIEVVSRVPVQTKDDLSLAYTPGVAQPCLEIQKDYDKSFTLTRRHNLVAVITDGTAVLGLGDIGPEAGMPVMEGKCALFKAFGDVDAFPLCIRSKDVDEIVRTIYLISGSFGGINLEDIAAPRCFEIERRLKELCDIPVFHDDQHGTAVVVGAALINALKVVKKDIGEARVVINGAGSAGIAIGRHLLNLGVKHMKMVDRFGILCEGEEMNPAQAEMARITNPEKFSGKLADAMKGASAATRARSPPASAGSRETAENRIPARRPRLRSRHAANASGARKRSIQGFARLISPPPPPSRSRGSRAPSRSPRPPSRASPRRRRTSPCRRTRGTSRARRSVRGPRRGTGKGTPRW